GATDRRMLTVAVAVDLHFAFAVPTAGINGADADDAPEEATRTAEAVDDDEVAPRLGRVLPTKGRVQHARIVGDRRLQRVVDLVVALDVARRMVVQHDSHVLA